MRFLALLPAVAMADSAFELPDLNYQPFLRDMIEDLQVLRDEMNTTEDHRASFERGRFQTQVAVAPEEERLIQRMVGFSAAAYCSDKSLRAWNCRHCPAGAEFVNVRSEFTTGGRGFVAVDHATKSIVISFRGSINLRNWVTNLDMLKEDFDVGDGTKGIQVHKGFLRYATAIGHKIFHEVRPLLAKHSYNVTITGHSLGGAVATLTCILMHKEFGLPWHKIHLVTFGEPRVGNEAFARWFNGRNPHHLRVVNNRDMVPHVPFSGLGYTHRKREIFLNGGKIHSCIAQELEDANCGISMNYFLSVLDHLHYLGTIFGLVC